MRFLLRLYDAPEHRKAIEADRWKVGLLDEASITTSEALGKPKVHDAWVRAYYLHVQGFHEAKLSTRIMRAELEAIEWLLDYAKEAASEKTRNVEDSVQGAELYI